MNCQDLCLHSLPQLCLGEWLNQDASLCVPKFHLIMAQVKPVGIEQEGMCTQGLKVKTLRKVISRRLSEKKKTHGTVSGCHKWQQAASKSCVMRGQGNELSMYRRGSQANPL